jgi:hypothetical protein
MAVSDSTPWSRVCRLVLLPGLLLLALVASAVHHHTGNDDPRSCAICTLSHAPAVTAVAAIQPSDTPAATRLFPLPPPPPRSTGPTSRSSRAPPAI